MKNQTACSLILKIDHNFSSLLQENQKKTVKISPYRFLSEKRCYFQARVSLKMN
ncbi:hypothetical protein MHA_2144 [Mannheimia haemolytica PHL213]|nr:hypothetical protein MHA_2144 [Mannheimia haemolytica PHL213]